MSQGVQFVNPDAGAALGGDGGSSKVVDFPLPWLDYASSCIPNSLTLVLRWAEYIWMSNGTYRQACQRTARYFITDLEFKEIEDDHAEDVKDIFEHYLKVKTLLSECGDNFICYGNLFLVRHIPFKRYLSCKCGALVPFNIAEEQDLYSWEQFKFNKSKKGCPSCGHKHPEAWAIHDVQSKDPKDVRIILLNPHEVDIAHNAYTKSKKLYWNLPSQLVNGIKEGIPIMLGETPEEIIEAAKGTKRLELDDSVVFHCAEPAPAGFFTGGWGLPRVISNFRLAYHHQVLNRYDQAIAMDYINGMRVISPEQSTAANGAGDPLLSLGGSLFRSAVQGMVSTHRKDPASWHISAFPLKYQLFGGEGQQLSPKDLMAAKLDEWLDATGVPAEFFHGTLSVQAAPMALRVFENSWPEIISLYNNVLEWVASYLMEVMDVPEFRVELMKPRIIDDLERRGMLLQLMGGNQISPQTALQTLGVTNPRDEIRRGFQWQQMAAQEEKKFNEEMQASADSDTVKQEWAQKSQAAMSGGAPMDPGAMGPGGAPPGGAPPGGAGGLQVGDTSTPESMMGEADRIAQQILQMDPTARRRTLGQLRKDNEQLANQVKGQLAKYENQAKTTGVSMLRQGQLPPGQ